MQHLKAVDQIIEPIEMPQGLRFPPPVLDPALLPEVLRTRSLEVAAAVGCDPISPIFSGLAAIAGAADARSRLEVMRGFRVPPIIWLMVIGRPAEKKSPGSKPMVEVLKKIELEDLPRYRAELREWKKKNAIYERLYKRHIDHLAESKDGDPPALPEVPPEPVPKRITVQDITSQKLVRKAAVRPEGLLCWLDEGHPWVKKICDGRSLEDRGTWTQGYEGASYEYDRVGAGSIWCQNLGVSVYANIQPKVFAEYAGDLAVDGMLQRFIPAVLSVGQTTVGNPEIGDSFLWEQSLRAIAAAGPRDYSLSEGAYNQFREYQHWHQEKLDGERLVKSPDVFIDALGKLTGQAARLAFIFHLVTDPYAPEVSAGTMDQAIRFVKEFVLPSTRYVYTELAGQDIEDHAAWFHAHILAISERTSVVTLGDLKHSAQHRLCHIKSQLARNSLVIDAMSELIQFNWVFPMPDQSGNVAKWQINPLLAERFKERRLQIIKTRQSHYDEIRQSQIARGKPVGPRLIYPGYDPETMD